MTRVMFCIKLKRPAKMQDSEVKNIIKHEEFGDAAGSNVVVRALLFKHYYESSRITVFLNELVLN